MLVAVVTNPPNREIVLFRPDPTPALRPSAMVNTSIEIGAATQTCRESSTTAITLTQYEGEGSTYNAIRNANRVKADTQSIARYQSVVERRKRLSGGDFQHRCVRDSEIC
jgi:hypothetical protein